MICTIVSLFISIFWLHIQVFLAYNLTNFFFVCPKFFSMTIAMILPVLQKYYIKFIFKNSLKEEGGVITGLDSGKRECLALNFRHVSFLQVRKNNPCQANIHVYAVYINKQTRFHFDTFSTSSKSHMYLSFPLCILNLSFWEMFEAIFVDCSVL